MPLSVVTEAKWVCGQLTPLSPSVRVYASSRHYLSYGDCLEDKRENYDNCSVLCCV